MRSDSKIFTKKIKNKSAAVVDGGANFLAEKFVRVYEDGSEPASPVWGACRPVQARSSQKRVDGKPFASGSHLADLQGHAF
jgi:hypothetical protein